MKKIIVPTVALLACLVVIPAHAFVVQPIFNLVVNKNSIGGDAVFNFNLKDLTFGNNKGFQIQTQNGFGSYLTTLGAFNGETTSLTEDSISGWQSSGVVCEGTNPQITTYPIAGGIEMIVQSTNQYQPTLITCTFTNVKQNSKTPVLIVPGILGTDINKGNDKLWLDLGHNFTDVGDQFMDPLQLNTDFTPTDSGLIIGDVIKKETLNLGFGQLKLFDYTFGLIQEFVDNGYTEGKDLFTFPYDWRYGVNDGNESALKQKVADIMASTSAAKVDVIAHSTGGLLVKKYVMDNPTDNHLDKVVFVGVPNLGAPKAVKVLLQGDNFRIPFLSDAEMKKIAANLPVSYDLLPSQTYFNQNGSFIRTISQGAVLPAVKDLNYNETGDFLLTDHSLNATAYTSAQNLHTTTFDSYDPRTAGVDTYNIIGCKTGTIGKFLENRTGDASGNYTPELVSGDGTVPRGSAESIPSSDDHTIYMQRADHGTLLSDNGSRQEIVNLIAGTNLATTSAVLLKADVVNDPTKCKLEGRWWQIWSPLSISVTDQNGNHARVADDGSIENTIPGADFEVFGDHKFVFVPTDNGQTYTTSLVGTGTGTFTFKSSDIQNGEVTSTEVFANVPVTPALTGTVNIADTTTLTLQNSPTDAPVAINPSAVLNATQSEDVTPPVTTTTITGTKGQPNFYRSNVTIVLSATDPIVSGDASQTSGVLSTSYNLDNTDYHSYNGASIPVSTEGKHTLSFFSTDRAGNNETLQTVPFTIDKTTPEFSIQFSPTAKDLVFTGIDNLSAPAAVSVLDKDDTITATDQAGNTTQIKLTGKNRKILLKAGIKSISYNNISSDISKNKLQFLWLFDKKGNLALLTQNVQSKNGFNIGAGYALNTTLLAGRDQTGKFSKTIRGLVLLKVSTKKGDLVWSY